MEICRKYKLFVDNSLYPHFCNIHDIFISIRLKINSSEMSRDNENHLLDISSLELPKNTLSRSSFSVISLPFHENSLARQNPKGIAAMIGGVERLRGANVFQKCFYIFLSLYLCKAVSVFRPPIYEYITLQNTLFSRDDAIVERERYLRFYRREHIWNEEQILKYNFFFISFKKLFVYHISGNLSQLYNRLFRVIITIRSK